MIDRDHKLGVKRQAELLNISRSSVYYLPRPVSEADLALRRADPPAGLMAHATCEGRPPARPLPVLVRHLRFGLRDIRDLEESPATLDGLPGTAQRFHATLDGVPVAVRAVTLRGPGCVYDLVGVAPPDALRALDPDFERFAAGFALGRAVQ